MYLFLQFIHYRWLNVVSNDSTHIVLRSSTASCGEWLFWLYFQQWQNSPSCPILPSPHVSSQCITGANRCFFPPQSHWIVVIRVRKIAPTCSRARLTWRTIAATIPSASVRITSVGSGWTSRPLTLPGQLLARRSTEKLLAQTHWDQLLAIAHKISSVWAHQEAMDHQSFVDSTLANIVSKLLTETPFNYTFLSDCGCQRGLSRGQLLLGWGNGN